MSDLNQILDEILNNHIYSTNEQIQSGKESDHHIRSLNDEVPNSDESDDDDNLDQIDGSKNYTAIQIMNNLSIMTTTTKGNDDETEDILQRNIQPRRSRRKSEDNKDDDDDDDSQHVPNINVSEKTKELAEDENNRNHPTYVPRKGKFFEHDDRTSNEHRSTKQETPRGKTRIYRDTEGKWPHDLYFRDQQIFKSTHGSSTRQAVRSGGPNVNRTYQSNHSDDHLSSIARRPPGFTTKDQHQTHYQRKFINRQYQQTDKGVAQQYHHRQRQQSLPSVENKEKEQQRKPNRPVELRVGMTQQRSSRPKSHHEGLENRSKLVHHSEQSKRYSNMRQTMNHSRPSQQPTNLREHNDWPQVPLSPLTYFAQQPTKSSSSYWYPQTSPDINTGQSPQVSRYFPTASAFQDQ